MTVQIISTIGGTAAGYLYYKFVGCKTGACPLTNTPLRAMLYGAFLGFMASGFYIR